MRNLKRDSYVSGARLGSYFTLSLNSVKVIIWCCCLMLKMLSSCWVYFQQLKYSRVHKLEHVPQEGYMTYGHSLSRAKTISPWRLTAALLRPSGQARQPSKMGKSIYSPPSPLPKKKEARVRLSSYIVQVRDDPTYTLCDSRDMPRTSFRQSWKR